MNYIDIKESAKVTGKSEKTIRRFLSKPESKAYTERKEGRLLVDVNYLLSVYPPAKSVQNAPGQKVDRSMDMVTQKEFLELKSELALQKQEIEFKNILLEEKENRIQDLQKSILLLEAPKEEVKPVKKRRWFF